MGLNSRLVHLAIALFERFPVKQFPSVDGLLYA
jgi:hypothetical protein